VYFPFTVLPKPSEVFKPRKSPFHDPTLRNHREFVKFVPFRNLDLRSKQAQYGVSEGFSAIPAIAQYLCDTTQIWGIPLEHINGALAVSGIGGGNAYRMR
jgi:hypothetical protein